MMKSPSPIIAIPDLHGHLRKLEHLLRKLKVMGYLADHRLVFLGDYFDRGPDIKSLIEFCIELKENGHIFLAGNHEFTLERALFAQKHRDEWVNRWWIRYEDRTFQNYGGILNFKNELEIANSLYDLMPQSHKNFLLSLPWVYEQPGIIALHAGIDPLITWQNQRGSLVSRARKESSMWGPPQIFSHSLAKWTFHLEKEIVVSGHALVPLPIITQNRVLLNCGVELGGPLVAWISDVNKIISVD